MPRPLTPFEGSKELPKKVDVVIIGGGIVGVATALNLAERGVSVAVCEKGVIGGEQSSRNFGLCRQTRRNPAEMPLMIEGIRIWKGLKERVGAETGFRQKGLLFTCDTEADIAAWSKELAVAKEFGLDTRILSSKETMDKVPGLERKLAGAIYTPSDGFAEPQHAAPAIAKGAAARGAIILTNCAVRGFETAGGRISAVVTERGPIACDTAVVATGAWSRRFLGNIGIDLPSLNIRTSIQATGPLKVDAPDESVYGSDFGWRKRLDGGWNISQLLQTAPIVPDSFLLAHEFRHILKAYYGGFTTTFGSEFFEDIMMPRRWKNDEVTPFEKVRVIEPPPQLGNLAKMKAKLDAVAPWFRDAKIAYQWTGVIDITSDELPVMCRVDERPGLVLATGFSGHGFGLGPVAGQFVADIVTNDKPMADPAPFRFDRFRRPVRQAA